MNGRVGRVRYVRVTVTGVICPCRPPVDCLLTCSRILMGLLVDASDPARRIGAPFGFATECCFTM